MKKTLLLVLATFCLSAVSSLAADYNTSAKDVRKERIEVQKMKTKDLDKLMKREIDREFEDVMQSGWRSKGGELSLRTALENSWTLEHEFDADLYPRAFVAEGTAMGKDYELTREKAISQAKSNLADVVQRELKLMLEWAENEKKIKPQDTKVVRASLVSAMKDLMTDINDIEVIMELSGAQGANNEVKVRVSFSGINLLQNARAAVSMALREKGEVYLAERVGTIFNWREATKQDKIKK